MRECMDAMRAALAEVSSGRAVLPLRTVVRLPGTSNFFATMPGGLEHALGAKVITVFPGNAHTALDSHQGAVLLFDPETGALRAVMDASAITGIRTAAVSGVATELLARPQADDLAILGSGVQAMTHLEAMLLARPIKRVRVWSRTPARSREFATRAEARFQITIECAPTAREAVEGAAIVCTTTASREPVLFGEWLAPGVHVNAVGASVPTARELDTAAVVRARLYVDRRESALTEAGDFLIPRLEGAITDAHIVGELGAVILGSVASRRADDEITLFKSLGIAVEDVASARLLYEKAQATGTGSWVAFGEER